MSRSDPASVGTAIAWIDGAACRLETELARLNQASGRVLGEDVRAAAPVPPADCAAVDGFAVRAAETIGAGAYNPLTVRSAAVAAGEALPAWADAVVRLDQAESGDRGDVVTVDPMAPGANVDRQGAVAAAAALLVGAGTRLMPRHIGLIAAAGLARVPLVRQPRVRLAIAGAVRSGAAADSDGPMLRAAIERDGGLSLESPLAEAFAAGADLVLVVGGTGPGDQDRSADALAEAGRIEIHGVALCPGETAGFGHTAAGAPVLLLPGTPAGCLWSYELFAGRAIRRFGGRDPALPQRPCVLTTARKIVSSIGVTEICPVRLCSDREIEPIAGFAEGGLMAAAGADGFVIVAESSEGYPQGASVTAYLYDER